MGTLGLDARLVSCAFACLSVVYCWTIQVIIFFCELKKIWKARTGQMETGTKSIKNITGGQACSCPSTPLRSTRPGSILLRRVGDRIGLLSLYPVW